MSQWGSEMNFKMPDPNAKGSAGVFGNNQGQTNNLNQITRGTMFGQEGGLPVGGVEA